MTNKEYWAERIARTQARLTDKNLKQINNQFKKYYSKAMKSVISDFEATYDKVLATQEAGKQVTPADLYQLDKYWQMQAQVKKELQKLGARQILKMSEIFETQFFDIYYSVAIPSQRAFATIDKQIVNQLINTIWCVDNKSFSDRVWDNVDNLIATLNDGLVSCVITGKKTTQLKKELRERFEVSYYKADRIVRTEMSHIQNQAAQKRYEDYGVKEFEVWADKDERRCDTCGKLHKTRYPMGANIPVPVHPNCRCSIIPVVED